MSTEKLRMTKYTVKVKIMKMKIDDCLRRVLRSKADSTTIKCSGETIHIKTEGLV